MSRWHSYINSAQQIIEKYKGNEPLPLYLKDHFRQHKKHGGSDRKHIAHLCYCFYRLGNNLPGISIEEKIKAALFLCNKAATEWFILYDEEWLNAWNNNLTERIGFIQKKIPSFSIENIFAWKDELSEGINSIEFAQSHLIQPDLFLRIRPGKKTNVIDKLQNNNVPFKEVAADCLALTNTTKIELILHINKEVVIQDYSSQLIAEFINPVKQSTGDKQQSIKVWDCCAASGGKSILAFDTLPHIELTVCDLRPSIINSLQLRFKEAGIKKYHSFAADLTKPIRNLKTTGFNFIICDAPCSGSGTWGRTPEQLSFFSTKKIEEYASLQKNIVSHVIPQLAAGGYFLYITCSVFKKENEAIVQFIETNFNLLLVKQELLKGYDKKADSMFAVLFQLKA